MIVEIINKTLSLAVIGSHITIILSAFLLIFLKKTSHPLFVFLAANALRLAFFVALIATSGSLFYSEYAKFAPCYLCWFQRIFMYPLVIIFGIAAFKKDYNIFAYTLPLAMTGWLISLYHNYFSYRAIGLTVCRLGESCFAPYVHEFGYITIPMMALTAFSLIIGLMLINKHHLSKN
jgi:disulfide bond formation protein DsbB